MTDHEPNLATRVLTFNRPCVVDGCTHVATEGAWCPHHISAYEPCRELVGFRVEVDERCPVEIVDDDGMCAPCGRETWTNCWAIDGDLLHQTCLDHGTEAGDAAASAMTALADAALLRQKIERAGISFTDDVSKM